MKAFYSLLCLALLCAAFTQTANAQGDVRSATGMPIPIGASVIWGQIELRGLKATETKPVVVVTLIHQGAPIATAQTNDKGYYYFLQRARDGAMLVVNVGGTEVGRQTISSAGGDRYDMTINWTGGGADEKVPGVITVKSLYADRSPTNDALFDKAVAAARAKNTGEAIKLYSQIVESDPKDFVAWTEIGTLYFTDGKHDKAENAYEKALAAKPDFSMALMNLGKLQYSQKQYDKAVVTFTNAAKADMNSADAFSYLGESYLQLKQGSKAVVALNEAIRLAPNEKAELHLRLAALYNAAGLKDRAANEYKLFLDKKPDHPDKAKLESYIKANSK